VGLSFVAVVVSTVNFLEITPLFFLGSTLIFIGFDLMYEWIAEVRHKVNAKTIYSAKICRINYFVSNLRSITTVKLLLSEYLVLLATFVAIQFLGIDGKNTVAILLDFIHFIQSNLIFQFHFNVLIHKVVLDWE
jgi:hypothetical protein